MRKIFITTLALAVSSVFANSPINVSKDTKDTKAAPVVKAESSKTYDGPISGKVVEKINAASYTYLKLKTKTDETWVAVPKLEIELNTQVEMLKPMPMFGFQSKILKRKFDRIYFGVLKSQTEAMAKQKL